MIAAVLISGMILAQDIEPKLEIVGNLVKVTYHYENGQIQQEGCFKDGKLQGQWVSFDVDGNKIAVAEYNGGEKVGKWFFWADSVLSEVDYSNNKVASVKNWKKDAIVNVD